MLCACSPPTTVTASCREQNEASSSPGAQLCTKNESVLLREEHRGAAWTPPRYLWDTPEWLWDAGGAGGLPQALLSLPERREPACPSSSSLCVAPAAVCEPLLPAVWKPGASERLRAAGAARCPGSHRGPRRRGLGQTGLRRLSSPPVLWGLQMALPCSCSSNKDRTESTAGLACSVRPHRRPGRLTPAPPAAPLDRGRGNSLFRSCSAGRKRAARGGLRATGSKASGDQNTNPLKPDL